MAVLVKTTMLMDQNRKMRRADEDTAGVVINTRYGKLLRSLLACHPQLAHIHHLRVQLHKAENLAGLAVVRRVLGISRRTLHGNVRISTHHLSLLRLAHEVDRKSV